MAKEIKVYIVKKVCIIDATALPREYLIPDDVLIRKDALAGKVIAGVEVYEEERIAAQFSTEESQQK